MYCHDEAKRGYGIHICTWILLFLVLKSSFWLKTPLHGWSIFTHLKQIWQLLTTFDNFWPLSILFHIQKLAWRPESLFKIFWLYTPLCSKIINVEWWQSWALFNWDLVVNLASKASHSPPSNFNCFIIVFSTKLVVVVVEYHRVASTNTCYWLENQLFVKRSQYVKIKNPLHKQSEKACMCF